MIPVAADGGLLSQERDPRAHVPPAGGAAAGPVLARTHQGWER